MKETVVAQQIKILRLERQGSKHVFNPPEATEAREKADRGAMERAEREERERAEEAARAKVEKAAKRKADREAKERVDREMMEKGEQEARMTAEKEAKAKADREEMERREMERGRSERWTDAEQGPFPTEPTPPALVSELMTPEPWPAPSLIPARQSPVPTPTSPAPPAKTEPEKPLSLWDRGVLGDSGGGRSIAMPTTIGDRQSGFTETARDRTRENQRENVVEGLLGSSAARRRNDSAQSQAPVRPAPRPTPQRSGGWGSWGNLILTNIASANSVADPDRLPSPELAPVKPKIENSLRGFAPSQPPTAQNTFTGPPFGSGVGKNLSVDTAGSLKSSLDVPGPENIPESAVEIKHVPAPGRFGSQKDETGDVQGDAWGWEEGDGKDSEEAPKVPSPTQQTEFELQPEAVGEPAKAEEVATPTEEDEFDWANTTKKPKKMSWVNTIPNTPSLPITPNPENWGGNTGVGAKKKKKKGGRYSDRVVLDADL